MKFAQVKPFTMLVFMYNSCTNQSVTVSAIESDTQHLHVRNLAPGVENEERVYTVLWQENITSCAICTGPAS